MVRKAKIPEGTKVRRINLSRKVVPCPRCGLNAKRHSLGKRYLHEVSLESPTMLEVKYSKHYCVRCRRHFSLPMDHLAPPSGRFTNRVHRTAVGLVIKQCLTLKKASQRMRQKYHVHVPPTTIHDWVSSEMD